MKTEKEALKEGEDLIKKYGLAGFTPIARPLGDGFVVDYFVFNKQKQLTLNFVWAENGEVYSIAFFWNRSERARLYNVPTRITRRSFKNMLEKVISVLFEELYTNFQNVSGLYNIWEAELSRFNYNEKPVYVKCVGAPCKDMTIGTVYRVLQAKRGVEVYGHGSASDYHVYTIKDDAGDVVTRASEYFVKAKKPKSA